MEYRVFRLIEKDIFESQWQKKKKHYEYRVDIYFLLFDERYGLKLRNKKKLELKKRQERSDNGQEYWIKTLKSHEKVAIEDFPSVLRILRNSNENELIEKFTSTKPMILCYLQKYREQQSLGSDLLYELTGCHVQFIRADDRSQMGSDLFFETLCVQSSNSNLIDANRIEKIQGDFCKENCEPMGYPEFLMRQYQKLMSS